MATATFPPGSATSAAAIPYQWPQSVRSAACFTVDVDAESPWLWAHRDRVPPTLGQLEMRRFGPRQGLGRLLELLDRHRIKGSFFVPGIVAETYPSMLPTLIDRGHEVGLHGYFHEIVADSSDDEFAHALGAAMALFRAQTGAAPVGFRSPAWEMTPGMLAELARHGLAYDSSLMGFDHPYDIGTMTELPVQWLTDDAIHFKFLGGGADKWPPSAPGGVLDGWRDEWRMTHDEGGLFMLTVHPWISGRGQRIALLDRLLTTIAEADNVWWARCDEIAAHHKSSANNGRYTVDAAPPDAIGPRRPVSGSK
ncbi:polysaccharide deacetylase [Fodinicurvata sp. EGI_FJ10296]|uniref:polysaccharide deacetylase family protein n=1 Tax=Fodinicurvata sp. EGI_FJ10296 TaxID=3231908 RepID=UPI003453ADDA